MNIGSLIIGMILGGLLVALIFSEISMREFEEMLSIARYTLERANKYHDRLVRIGNKVIDEKELIDDKLTTEIIDIITEDVKETKEDDKE